MCDKIHKLYCICFCVKCNSHLFAIADMNINWILFLLCPMSVIALRKVASTLRCHCYCWCHFSGRQLMLSRKRRCVIIVTVCVIFTVRRYALHGICYRNSVCPSVRPSVCLSVTLADCVHMVRPTIMISSPPGSPIILVSGDITFIPKFEGGHPKRGH